LSSPRLLTKSRFNLAHECPTKLFYQKKKEYADQSSDDQFLKALAEGGYQVGELAKLYFPDGTDVKTLDHAESLRETAKLLELDEVIIFEAAIQFEDFFVRVDILKKVRNRIELIEVKSKSFHPGEDEFLGKRGGINAEWNKYLHDVAFQTFVLRRAFPKYQIDPFLLLADKSALCPTSGLNQKFTLKTDQKGRVSVEAKQASISKEDLSKQILILKDVSAIVDSIITPEQFAKEVRSWATAYKNDQKIPPQLSSACKKCQFFKEESDDPNLKSGKTECWSEYLKKSPAEIQKPTILELWNSKATDKFLEQGKYFLEDLSEEDFKIKSRDRSGLSQSERQWLQVKKVKEKDASVFIDRSSLTLEMQQWLFPLHFIDFETTRAAIPFYKDHRPYEGIAFQFSHHILEESGRIHHAGEYLHTKRGEFPNFHFIRALKAELDKDQGTIFRYATHENTFLNVILAQLQRSQEPDKDDLITFIQSITRPTKDTVNPWEPNREMVDMLELVKLYYFDPSTGGSNSIKDVLPAVLRDSKYLKEKYSKPVYGSASGIISKNFENHAWVKFDNKGNVEDPYSSLPSILSIADKATADFIFKADKLSDGGAAMTAWARMQFTEMTDVERNLISQALLRYCELDTFAMVMIYEHWREILKHSTEKRSELRKSNG
jgi:hypothetical protein